MNSPALTKQTCPCIKHTSSFHIGREALQHMLHPPVFPGIAAETWMEEARLVCPDSYAMACSREAASLSAGSIHAGEGNPPRCGTNSRQGSLLGPFFTGLFFIRQSIQIPLHEPCPLWQTLAGSARATGRPMFANVLARSTQGVHVC